MLYRIHVYMTYKEMVFLCVRLKALLADLTCLAFSRRMTAAPSLLGSRHFSVSHMRFPQPPVRCPVPYLFVKSTGEQVPDQV